MRGFLSIAAMIGCAAASAAFTQSGSGNVSTSTGTATVSTSTGTATGVSTSTGTATGVSRSTGTATEQAVIRVRDILPADGAVRVVPQEKGAVAGDSAIPFRPPQRPLKIVPPPSPTPNQ